MALGCIVLCHKYLGQGGQGEGAGKLTSLGRRIGYINSNHVTCGMFRAGGQVKYTITTEKGTGT